jgi:hypothetical protein
MSFLLTLNEDDLGSILVDQLPKYEKKIKAAEAIFNLDGRKLEEIIRTVPQHQASYDKSYQELKSLEDWIANQKDKKVAKLWKKYNEGYSRALSTKDITSYIAGEKDIVEINQIIIEVTLLKNHMLSITDSIKQIGWMVSHITKLRVAELQETIL